MIIHNQSLTAPSYFNFSYAYLDYYEKLERAVNINVWLWKFLSTIRRKMLKINNLQCRKSINFKQIFTKRY